MQVLARLGIVVLMTLPGMISPAESSKVDFAKIGQQLQRYARDLRDVGKSMQAHARTTMADGLDKDQEASLSAQRQSNRLAAG